MCTFIDKVSIKSKLYFWNKVCEIIAQLSSNQQLIICGDFNCEDLGVGFMIDTIKDVATFKRTQMNRTISSITDHILLFKNVEHQTSQTWVKSFDHSILSLNFDTSLLLDTAQQNEYVTISKQRAIKCCEQFLNKGNIESFSCFYLQYKKCLWKKRIISKTRIRIKPIQYKTGNNYLEQLKTNLQNDKKEFFNVIKKTLILHQQRRDGSIFNCFISDAKRLCTGKEIFVNCTQILDKLSNIQQQEPKPIPQLPELSQEEVQNMQNKMAYDKAISYDGITHQFIKDCNWKIINDIWNKNTFEVNKKLGWVRLCPLNKCHPEIPKCDQFRPLVIMSPLLKFLELRFHDKLQDYLKNRILKPQTGFISGMGTHVNIFLLLDWVRQTQKEKSMLNIH